MPDSLGRRRALLGACAIAVAIGAWLVASGVRERGRAVETGSPGSPPVPGWVVTAPTRAFFLGRLAAASTPVPPLSFRFESLAGSFDVLRTLAAGEEYLAQVRVRVVSRSGAGDAEIEVRRDGVLSHVLRAALEGGRVTRTTAGPDREHQTPLETGALPFALGDFRLDDALGLAGAVAGGAVRVAGRLEAPGARTLLVLDAPLAAPGAPDRRDGAPARALVYLDAQSGAPAAVRVFDAGDRLVRTYDGFRLDPRGRLADFRIASLPLASATTVHADSLEVH